MKVKATGRSHKVVLEMGSRDSTLPAISLPEVRLRQILVPVDFSDCSHKALHYAASFAKQFNAEVLLLHVIISVPPPPQMLVFEGQEFTAAYHEETSKQLMEWRDEVGSGVSVRAVVRNGTAAHYEITEAARESNSDLIVIGNQGRTGLSRMLIGSTAERVVRNAPCPVLVIREREHDFIAESKSAAAEQSITTE
ncbi:MAG: universal stress protein [Verrucomicrobiota bacterium]